MSLKVPPPASSSSSLAGLLFGELMPLVTSAHPPPGGLISLASNPAGKKNKHWAINA
jgi:hypothetical protein